jgi:hypothetical protein
MNMLLKLFVICILAGLTINVNGQINLKDRLKQSVNKAVDNAVKNKNTNQQGQAQHQETAKNQQAQQQNQDQAQASDNEAEQTPPPQEQTQLQAFSKYDFIPGEKVIFFEDFSQDAIGDFPALWNTNGSAEVVTTNLYEGKWMKFSTEQAIWTDQPLNLPKKCRRRS